MENRTFVGWRIIQRNAEHTLPLFAFVAPVKDVVKWAGVRRTAEVPNGTQRLVRPARVKAITRFLSVDGQNLMPNSILVCFQPAVTTFEQLTFEPDGYDNWTGVNEKLKLGKISFVFDETAESHNRPALVVDGQHRLLGLSKFDDENIPILVVALLDATVQEQAFQFIVINNKAVRVPTDNVKAILAGINEKALTERLLGAGVKYGDVSPVLREVSDLDQSPFQNLLAWDYNKGQKLVSLTTIEQSLRYICVEFPNLSEDEDSLLGFFFAIWRGVKNAFPALWAQDNAFMTKANLNALNEFIVHRVKMAWEFGILDIYDLDHVETQAQSIVEMLTVDFWQTSWSIKIQDNANTRNLIVKDLEKMVENRKYKRHWNEDLKLIMMDCVAEERI
jgi:DGQHR domain-containing protein